MSKKLTKEDVARQLKKAGGISTIEVLEQTLKSRTHDTDFTIFFDSIEEGKAAENLLRLARKFATSKETAECLPCISRNLAHLLFHDDGMTPKRRSKILKESSILRESLSVAIYRQTLAGKACVDRLRKLYGKLMKNGCTESVRMDTLYHWIGLCDKPRDFKKLFKDIFPVKKPNGRTVKHVVKDGYLVRFIIKMMNYKDAFKEA
jgi:hypothetical protein